MAHLAVTVVLLFLACAYAAPVVEKCAPKPGNPKFTIAKDSSLGLGLAADKSKAHGLVQANQGLETPVEAPLPGNTGDNVPDVTLVENVNAGGAFATGGSIATGVVKNNKFANDPTKGSMPFFGKK